MGLLSKLYGKTLWKLAERLPEEYADRYWSAKCPVCGEEREWHQYGTFFSRKVYIDGHGLIPCASWRAVTQ